MASTSQSAAGAARSDRLKRAIEDRIQLTAQSSPRPSDTPYPSDAPLEDDAAAHETATARWKRASAVALDAARREGHGHDGGGRSPGAPGRGGNPPHAIPTASPPAVHGSEPHAAPSVIVAHSPIVTLCPSSSST